MSSLIKDSKKRSPFWYCCYTAANGKRLKRSTKQTDREKAKEVCRLYVNAEKDIGGGRATEKKIRRVINDVLFRLGEKRLNDPSIKDQLDGWVASKRGSVSDTTLAAYEQTR